MSQGARFKFIDTTVPRSPPGHNEPNYTIEDFVWVLDRFTGPNWNVKCYESKMNKHTRGIFFKIKLEHDNGSTIRIVPIDSTVDLAGNKILDSYRVYGNEKDTEQSRVYYVPDSIEPIYSSVDDLKGHTSHPRQDLSNSLEYASYGYIQQIEEDLRKKKEPYSRPNRLENLQMAITTAIGIAQQVSRRYQKQTDLLSFSH